MSKAEAIERRYTFEQAIRAAERAAADRHLAHVAIATDCVERATITLDGQKDSFTLAEVNGVAMVAALLALRKAYEIQKDRKNSSSKPNKAGA